MTSPLWQGFKSSLHNFGSEKRSQLFENHGWVCWGSGTQVSGEKERDPADKPVILTPESKREIGSYDCQFIIVSGEFMTTRKYTVLLEAAEEGGFVVKSTELPVASQGETKEEALKNIKEAIEGYLETKAQLLKRKAKVEKAEVVVEAPSALLAESC